LPKGSRILDVGCGIGGSSRILAKYYGFNVTGITISPAQVKRARELTPFGLNCNFQVMDALNLEFDDGSFDGVWSVEAGALMNDKTKFADEMMRTLRPGGFFALADWNSRDLKEYPPSFFEKLVLKQLLEQWVHPNFISIKDFGNILRSNKNSAGQVISENWNSYTNPSWFDSIIEGIRRPFAILSLGPLAIVKSIREIPTILLMNWAFRKGLMEFGVYKCRG
jgi:MPBQ/MSBQ methyltransferase